MLPNEVEGILLNAGDGPIRTAMSSGEEFTFNQPRQTFIVGVTLHAASRENDRNRPLKAAWITVNNVNLIERADVSRKPHRKSQVNAHI